MKSAIQVMSCVVASQIVGIGQSLIGLEISVTIEGTIVIPRDTEMIVEVWLLFNNEEPVVYITQSIPANSIVQGNSQIPSLFKLQGILWVKGYVDTIEVMESGGVIYAINYT
ncbi:MAG: hypothetical protein ACRCTE_13780 [Cellulosilyticaceae bacterium]